MNFLKMELECSHEELAIGEDGLMAAKLLLYVLDLSSLIIEFKWTCRL